MAAIYNGTFELTRCILAALERAPFGLSVEAMAKCVGGHDPRLVKWAVVELRNAGLIEADGSGHYCIASASERPAASVR